MKLVNIVVLRGAERVRSVHERFLWSGGTNVDGFLSKDGILDGIQERNRGLRTVALRGVSSCIGSRGTEAIAHLLEYGDLEVVDMDLTATFTKWFDDRLTAA